MRFTVEQVFLTDSAGAGRAEQTHYDIVEADSVDDALAHFLRSSSATIVGPVQKFPGFQAVATARTGDGVFMVSLLPGSDVFHRRR